MRRSDSEESELCIPNFEADSIPIELAGQWDSLTDHQKFLVKKSVITGKQIEFCMERLVLGHRSIHNLKADVIELKAEISSLNRMKDILLSYKGAIVAILVSAILPLLVAYFGAQWGKEKTEHPRSERKATP